MRLGRKLAEGFAVDPAIGPDCAEAEAERPGPVPDVPDVPDAAPVTVEVSAAADAPQERPLPV
jgi:hypothetical protein